MEKPLTGKYKGLLTASYQTPLGIWQFDATLQLNGGGRMPAPYELADGQLSWSRRYGSFEQLSMQVTRYFRRWSIYVGGENLTNFKQKNPIIDAANPWGDNFDSTMIWGPVHGAKAYVGIRFKKMDSHLRGGSFGCDCRIGERYSCCSVQSGSDAL